VDQASYFWSGGRAEKAESGDEVLARAQEPGVWGCAVSSPSEVRSRVPAAKRFSNILEAPDGLSWRTCWGPSSWSPSPPLNPPMVVG